MTSTSATVLVVDDDATIRLLLGAGLANLGFCVLEADNGHTALELFRTRRPDLVLIDVSMPGLNGFQLVRAMHSMLGGAFLPLVMLTGSDDLETRRKALEAGATDVITKPFQLRSLANFLHGLLKEAV
ncbi:MAG: response regulator [Pseudomonadota bacterium]|uniref:response regulator n=1 Tax=Halomonas alkaliantarctica TaxID=232346 RepID=UPI0004AAC0B0|nr:response regulator [Halomonas alkaliantarctica]